MSHPPYQTATIMRGPERIREITATYLSSALPTMLADAATQWNIPTWQLPAPDDYKVYDPLGVKLYPVVGLLVNNSRQFPHTDYGEAMEDEYWIRYATRIFVYAKTPKDPTTGAWADPPYDYCIKTRDNLLTLVRACILAKQSFGFPDEFRIVEETISEDYLEAIRPNEQQPAFIAGGYISVDMEHRELIYRQPVSEADTVNLTVGLIHPAEM